MTLLLRSVFVGKGLNRNIEDAADTDRRPQGRELFAPANPRDPGAVTAHGVGQFLVGQGQRPHRFRHGLEFRWFVTLACHVEDSSYLHARCQPLNVYVGHGY